MSQNTRSSGNSRKTNRTLPLSICFVCREPIVECAGPIRQGKTHSSESLPAPSTSRDEPLGDSGAFCVPADESGQPVEPGAELFVEGRYGQQIRIPTCRRDDLQAHGQAGLIEARRNADRGRAPKGRPYN